MGELSTSHLKYKTEKGKKKSKIFERKNKFIFIRKEVKSLSRRFLDSKSIKCKWYKQFFLISLLSGLHPSIASEIKMQQHWTFLNSSLAKLLESLLSHHRPDLQMWSYLFNMLPNRRNLIFGD